MCRFSWSEVGALYGPVCGVWECVCKGSMYVYVLVYVFYVCLLLARTVEHTHTLWWRVTWTLLGFADQFLALTLFVNKRPLCGYGGATATTKTQVRLAKQRCKMQVTNTHAHARSENERPKRNDVMELMTMTLNDADDDDDAGDAAR